MLLPKDLEDVLKEGNCGLFIGAGVSMDPPSSLPNWKSVLLHLIDKAETKKLKTDMISTLKEEIDNSNFLAVAEYLHSYLGVDFTNFLYDIFNGESLVPNENHKIITQIDCPIIITTNYDKLLENAFVAQGINPLVTTADNNAVLQKLDNPKARKKLFKIHGTIDNPNNLVLSDKTYTNLLMNEQFSLIVKSYLHRYSFAFIGYSLKDPDILLFLKNLKYIFDDFTPCHYALVREKDVSEISRVYFKDVYNIDIVTFKEFEELPRILNHVVEIQREYRNTLSEVIKYSNDSYELNILDNILMNADYISRDELDYFLDEGTTYSQKRVNELKKPFQFITDLFDELTSLDLIKNSEFPEKLFNETLGNLHRLLERVSELPRARKADKIITSDLHRQTCNTLNDLLDALNNFSKICRILQNLRIRVNPVEEKILSDYRFNLKQFK